MAINEWNRAAEKTAPPTALRGRLLRLVFIIWFAA
jgi:hypothetical protein